MLVKKAELSEHLEKDCKCRLESCEFCKRKLNLNKTKVSVTDNSMWICITQWSTGILVEIDEMKFHRLKVLYDLYTYQLTRALP